MNEMIGTLLDFTRLRFQAPCRSRSPIPISTSFRERSSRNYAQVTVREKSSFPSAEPSRCMGCTSHRPNLHELGRERADTWEPGSPVWISVSGDARDVVIAVSNRGERIPPEHAERLFDLFRQEDMGRRGVGLGLFIVREIVRGTVGVDSTNEMVTFEAKIPRTPPS
ncbi:MAG: HAMP domain-containing sensor histidine kinase [Kofleriaceae bacterium]